MIHPWTDEQIQKLWYIYTMEYYSAIKQNAFESVLMRWMNLELLQSEKDKYCVLKHVYGIQKDSIDEPIVAGQQWRRRHREQTCGHSGEGEGGMN